MGKTKPTYEELQQENDYLLKQSDLHKTMLDHSVNWEILMLSTGEFSYCSPSCKIICGYEANEFIENPDLFFEIIHPLDKESVNEHFDRKKHGVETDTVLEFRIITKDGNEKWIEHFCRKAYDKSGEFVGYRSSNMDISERKATELELQQTNNVLHDERQIFTQGNAVVFKWKNTQNWPVEYVSPNVEQIFGFTPDEMQSPQYRYSNFIFPEDIERVASEVSKFIIRNENYFEHEPYRIIGKNGKIHWVSDYTVILRNDAGEITHYIGYLIDISELKSIEESLRESEENLFITLNSIGDGVIATDEKGMVTKMNPVAEKLCGWPIADARGKHLTEVFKIINAQTRELVKNPIDIVMEKGVTVGLANHTILISKNGNEYHIADSAAPIKEKEGKIVGVILVFTDVTEEYNTQKIIEENEKRYRVVFQNSPVGIMLLYETGIIYDANEENAIITGYSIDELIDSDVRQLVEPENVYLVDLNIKRILSGEIIEHEVISCRKDGSRCVLFLRETSILLPNGKQGVLSISSDITESKRLNDLLRESEEKYRFIAENTTDIITLLDLNLKYTYISPAVLRRRGYTVEEAMLQKLEEAVSPETMKRVYQLLAEELANEASGTADPNRSRSLELEQYCKDGSTIWVDISLSLTRDANGTATGIFAVSRDITERIKSREALNESERRYKTLFEAANYAIFLMKDGIFLDCNQKTLLYFGCSKDEIIGHSPVNFSPAVQPDGRSSAEKAAEKIDAVLKGEPQVFEWAHQRRDGSVFSAEVSLNRVHLTAGTHIMALVQDITERKLAEEALRVSEERYRMLFNLLPYGCEVINPAGIITDCNPGAAKMLSYSKEEIIGQPITKFLDAASKQIFKEKFPRLLKGESQEAEIKMLRKDGKLLNILRASSPILDEKGNFAAVLALSVDITERKQAEEALKEKEVFLQTIFDGILEPMHVIDRNYKVLLSNKKLLELKNVKQEDIRGKYCYEAYYERNELCGQCGSKEVFQTGKPNSLIKTLLMPNGTYRYFEVYSFPLLGENGEVKQVLVMTKDITERKQAEGALLTAKEKAEKNERQYFDLYTLIRLMSDTMPDMLWAKNLKSEYIFTNKAFCTGLLNATDTEEPLGKNDMFFALRQRNSQPDNPEWHTFGEICRDSDADTLEAMKPMQFDEFGNVKGKFLFLDVHKAPLYDSDGQLIGVVGSARDVTAAKAAENQLRKLSWAVEQSPASVVITDIKGTIEYVNPKFTEITGYTSEEAIGQSPRILKSGDQALEVYTELWETISAGKEWKGELHNKKKNGELYWESVLISPIKNEKEEILYFLGVKEDITEKKLIEQELITAKEKAEESDRLKSAFLANMSHEIRTPMNGILGFADLLKEPDLSCDVQADYIAIIEKSGKRMLNIINDIVDISKIEAGLMKLDIKESNVNEQIEYTYTFFKPEAEAKGIELSFKNSSPAKEATIKTDREKLYAILTNLLKNAIKYTEKGSIVFGYEKKGEYIEFYVKDTGIGIPKDRQEAIFERFIQADIADKMARQGAGLGLAITKAYIEKLGGKIWVESNEGKGSTFYFTLPYNPEPASEVDRQPEPSEKNETVRKLKILIAEDDEASEILISINIKEFSKEIIKVRTGSGAVESCRNNPDIDLILMDIQMPDLNGYEATREIREFNEEVIIIAQTAYALTGDKEKALEAGCNDYIAKPVNKDDLYALIQKYFSKKEK